MRQWTQFASSRYKHHSLDGAVKISYLCVRDKVVSDNSNSGCCTYMAHKKRGWGGRKKS